MSDEEQEKYLTDGRRKHLKQQLQERGAPCDDETITYTLKGNDLKRTFLKQLPALKDLIDTTKEAAAVKNQLMGLDGRILNVRSQHAALNTLLQSAGAISVKKATCIFWEDLRREGIASKVKQVAHIHDEFQCLVINGYEEQVGQIAINSFKKAGEYFEMRCPLDGEFKYGKNWAETH